MTSSPTPPADDLSPVLQELKRHLLWQEDSGIREVLVARGAPRTQGERPPLPVHAHVSENVPVPVPGYESVSVSVAVPVHVPVPVGGFPSVPLDEIRRNLGDCRRCKLCQGRNKLVFGSGNPK